MQFGRSKRELHYVNKEQLKTPGPTKYNPKPLQASNYKHYGFVEKADRFKENSFDVTCRLDFIYDQENIAPGKERQFRKQHSYTKGKEHFTVESANYFINCSIQTEGDWEMKKGMEDTIVKSFANFEERCQEQERKVEEKLRILDRIHKNKVIRVEAMMREKVSEIMKKSMDNEILREKMEQMTEEYEKFRAMEIKREEERQKTMREYEEQLLRNDIEKAKLKEEVREKILEYENEIKRWKGKVKEQEEKNRQWEEERQEENVQVEAKYEELQKEKDTMEEEWKKKLESFREQSEKVMKMKDQGLKTAEEKLEIARKETEALKELIESESHSVSELKDKLASKEKDSQEWIAQLKEKEERIIELQETVKNQQERQQQLYSEKIDLKKEMELLKQQKQQTEFHLTEKKDKVEQLLQQIQQMDYEKKEVEKELLSEIKKMESSMESKLREKQMEVAAAHDEYILLRSKSKLLDSQQKQEIRNLKMDLENSIKQKEEWKKLYEDLGKELQGEKDRYKQEYSKLKLLHETHVAELKKQWENHVDLSTLQKEMADLTLRYSALEQEFSSQSNKLANYSAYIDKINRKLRETSSQLQKEKHQTLLFQQKFHLLQSFVEDSQSKDHPTSQQHKVRNLEQFRNENLFLKQEIIQLKNQVSLLSSQNKLLESEVEKSAIMPITLTSMATPDAKPKLTRSMIVSTKIE